MDKKDSASETGNLEKILEKPHLSVGVVDTIANVTYSLVVGSLTDYFAGLNLAGILTSRATGTVVNALTGRQYCWWREKAFAVTSTNQDSRAIRKTLVDLCAFNTFQVPLYAGIVAFGSYISEGRMDLEKACVGGEYLVMISPVVGPTIGWYIDLCRAIFGIKTAAQGAIIKREKTE